jgi:WD40 repeat protein
LTYIGHIGNVAAVAWSPDSKHIASAGFDKTVQVWNAVTGKYTWIYCCLGWVNGITWSPDGRYVASANSNRTVQIWESASDHPVMTYRDYKSEVLTVAWSPDGLYIASGDDDGLVHISQSPT